MAHVILERLDRYAVVRGEDCSAPQHSAGPRWSRSVWNRVQCKVEMEAEETTEMIKGLKTSLVQKGLVVSAQEMIVEGYDKSCTKC